MVPIIVAEMVAPEKYGAYNGIVALAIALSFLLGPLVGGAISDQTTWRWIFWINLPIGFASMALVLLIMPANFPDIKPSNSTLFTEKQNGTLRKIDFPGFSLLLAACVLLIVALEEAGKAFAWDSVLVIIFLTLAGLLLCVFFAWQRFLFGGKSAREPIIPWNFLQHRVLMGIYL